MQPSEFCRFLPLDLASSYVGSGCGCNGLQRGRGRGRGGGGSRAIFLKKLFLPPFTPPVCPREASTVAVLSRSLEDTY